MTDDLGTGELSSPATNGATGDSASAVSVPSNSGAKAIESALTLAVTEIYGLAEENRQLKRFKGRYNDVEAMLLIAGIAARVGMGLLIGGAIIIATAIWIYFSPLQTWIRA
jgi:hypothetical protein